MSKTKTKTMAPTIRPNDSYSGRMMPYVTVACDNNMLQKTSSGISTLPSPDIQRASDNGQTVNASQNLITASLSMQPSKAPASEQLIYKGICKLLSPQDGRVLFIVSFSLKIQTHSDRAVLSLSAANKLDKVYNVLDLAPPMVKNDCCHIHSTKAGDGFSCLLQFSSPTDAGKFRLYLEHLQQAASRSKLGTTNTAKQLQDKCNNSAMHKVSTELKSSSSVIASAESAVQPIRGSRPADQLVDVDSHSQASDVEPASDVEGAERVTIEDAAEKLFDVIENILPEAAAAGLQLSEAAIHDIEDTAIDSWLTRGFLISETDDMKSELLDLLRILVRIKRKAKSRKHTVQFTPTIQSLKDYDAVECGKPKPARIKYTPSEIESLASAQIPTPSDLTKSLMTPNQKPKTATLAKHKTWLAGGTVPPSCKSIEGSAAQTTDEQINVREHTTVVQQSIKEQVTPLKRTTSTSTGLGTSR